VVEWVSGVTDDAARADPPVVCRETTLSGASTS